MMGPVLGMALGILLLAAPYIVLAVLFGTAIGGVSLIVKGAAGGLAKVAAGVIILAASVGALLTIRTWATTCPPAQTAGFDAHKLVHDQMAMIRDVNAAMQATRRGTVIGMKLGGDRC
jgi:hypothetical protein